MRIFLSYRRGDTAGYSGRLYDGLVDRLGPDNVFHDTSVIPPGQDFTVVLDRALDQTDAVLAVIGPAWLTATTFDGRQRLQQQDDYVRLELAHALNRGLPVVPVLVGGAVLPPPGELPEDLKPLANRQAVSLHDESWRQDVDDLLARLAPARTEPTRKPARKPTRLIAAAAAVVIAALVGGGIWWAVGSADEPRGVAAGSGASEVASEITPSEAEVASEQDLPTKVSCGTPEVDAWIPLPLNADPVGSYREGDGTFTFTVREAMWRPLASGQAAIILATSMENDSKEEHYHGDWLYESLIVGQRSFPQRCFAPTPELVEAQTIGDAIVGFEVRCEPVGYMQLVLSEAKARIDVTESLEPGPC